MVGKKDWEKVLKDNEDQKESVLKNYELFLPQIESVIELAKKKIAEYPKEEEEEVPEDMKALLTK